MNILRRLRLLLPGVLLLSTARSEASDMLVITPRAMAEEAEELASLHRDLQGLSVTVTVDCDICDNPDDVAVRDYVRRHYADDGLRYLLLIGEGYGDTHSDAWYGIMSADNDLRQEWFTMPDIAVGRIPAVNPAQLAAYVEKARRHLLEATPRYFHDILIACDNGDGNEHLDRAERLAREFAGSAVHKAYIDLDRMIDSKAVITRSRIVRSLSDGVGFMLYVGHGNSTSVTGEGLWDVAGASSLRNSHAPWAFFSSCAINSFRNFETTLAEAMIYNPAGGAIGVIAATDAVYSSYNQEIALSFVDKRNNMTAPVAIGDLWLATQRECIAAAAKTLNSYYGRNVTAYTLAADPALPCYTPVLDVDCVVPRIVNPCERFTVSGEISIDEPCDGFADITVYAPEVDKSTLGQAGETPRQVTCGGVELWRGMARVTGSRFTTEVSLPDAGPGDISIAVHFTGDDGRSGYGKSPEFAFGPMSGPVRDITPPVIELRHESGLLIAEVSDDESGVNSSSLLLGSSPMMTVDGSVRMPFSVSCLDDEVTVFTADVRHLAAGSHEASFAVSDNAGNRAESRCQFTLAGNHPVLELNLDDEVARDYAVFSWSHDMTGEVTFTVIVTDITGETVLNRSVTGADSCSWSLAGVDSGIYLVRLLATDGVRHVASEPRRLIVIR